MPRPSHLLATALGLSVLLLSVAAWRPAWARDLARVGLRTSADLVLLAGLAPGGESTRHEDLHPDFRARIERVEERLRNQGYEVAVASAWRSDERQDAIWLVSQLLEAMGSSPGTHVRGGESCHNQELDGAPASAAIDLRPGRVLDLDARAEFYWALGRAAEAEGLRWGGRWSRSNPAWATYGLGWDPGHVEDQALCRRLRGG